MRAENLFYGLTEPSPTVNKQPLHSIYNLNTQNTPKGSNTRLVCNTRCQYGSPTHPHKQHSRIITQHENTLTRRRHCPRTQTCARARAHTHTHTHTIFITWIASGSYYPEGNSLLFLPPGRKFTIHADIIAHDTCECRLHLYDLYAFIQHAEIVRNVF